MSEQGAGIVEAARARSGGDPQDLEVELALALACVSPEVLEELDRALPSLVRRERRSRKGGLPNAPRRRLAERLLAMPAPTEQDLRQLLDDASFGDVPRELCTLWLPRKARVSALRVLATPPDDGPADEVQIEEAIAMLAAGELRPVGSRVLKLAMERWMQGQPSDLRAISRALAACEDPAVIAPLADVLFTRSDWRQRHRLAKALARSPVGAAALVDRLTRASDDDLVELLVVVPPSTYTPLACVLWSLLWRGNLREWALEACWEALGRLREPAALVELLRAEAQMPGLGIPGPTPNLRALLDMVARKDARLEALWDKPLHGEEGPPTGPRLWRMAISLVPGSARSEGGQIQARRVLSQALDRELTQAGEPEDIRLIGLSAGMLGDLEALPLVLESLQRQGPRDSVCLALRALGEQARSALPWLEDPQDPWAWLAREAIEPHDPQWREKLARWLHGPDAGDTARETRLQYDEGLITYAEMQAKLLLHSEAMACLRSEPQPPWAHLLG